MVCLNYYHKVIVLERDFYLHCCDSAAEDIIHQTAEVTANSATYNQEKEPRAMMLRFCDQRLKRQTLQKMFFKKRIKVNVTHNGIILESLQ